MRHEFRDLLRDRGWLRKAIPGQAVLRASFAARLDAAAQDNARLILTAPTPPDTVPRVTMADLGNLTDLRDDVLTPWDRRLAGIAAGTPTSGQLTGKAMTDTE